MADNTNTKLLERERIIFLQGIKEKDAIDLSNKYPNLVIFSNGDKFSDVWNGTQYNNPLYQANDSIKYDKDTILGCSIIKNGVSYTLVKGVHPEKNRIKLGDRYLRIYMDGNGLLNFVYGDHEIIFNDRGTIIQTRYIADREALGNLPIPERIYTITWDPNGGNITNGNNTSEIKWWWEKNENNIENSNYWVTPSTSTDKITTTTAPEEDTTYYAYWGTAPNGTLDNIKPTEVKKQYYTFNKWTYNGADYQNINVRDINEDRTYIAQWTLNNYYWYIGATQQDDSSSNPTIVSNNTSEGWRKINNTPSNFTSSNPLFNSNINIIEFNNKPINYPSYLYLPKPYIEANLKMYDIFGNDPGLYLPTDRIIIINGIEYKEYKRSTRHTGFSGILLYKK